MRRQKNQRWDPKCTKNGWAGKTASKEVRRYVQKERRDPVKKGVMKIKK